MEFSAGQRHIGIMNTSSYDPAKAIARWETDGGAPAEGRFSNSFQSTHEAHEERSLWAAVRPAIAVLLRGHFGRADDLDNRLNEPMSSDMVQALLTSSTLARREIPVTGS
jgi:hypothetical protein